MRWMALIIGGLWLAAFPAAADRDPDRIRFPGSPREQWSHGFPEDVRSVVMASRTGAVAVHTETAVFYFRDQSRPAWTAAQDWKHVEGLGISRDGDRVLFQTDTKAKQSTEGMTLTLHYFNGAGEVIWEKANPYRYQSVLLSPGGRRILIGELLHPGIRVHDENLNLLWEKEAHFWHLRFDPTDSFLFDGEGGLLYGPEGNQVWDFGQHARILSVADQASYIMTQYFRTVRTGNSIFLLGRRELAKVELTGTGGCVGPDGTLSALVGLDKKLGVYRTGDLLSGGMSAKPLFSTGFQRPWMIQIARDNRSLLVMGAESDNRSVIMLLDLQEGKVAWKKEVDPALRLCPATEDNRLLALQPDPRTVACWRCY